MSSHEQSACETARLQKSADSAMKDMQQVHATISAYCHSPDRKEFGYEDIPHGVYSGKPISLV